MDNFVDLTGPDPVVLTASETIDLCSSSSEEDDLVLICNPFIPATLPLSSNKDVENNDTESDESSTEFDDDSSLGMGNAYGEFSPLYDMKVSIARYGYLEFDGFESKSLSADSWYLEKLDRGKFLLHGFEKVPHGLPYTKPTVPIPSVVQIQRWVSTYILFVLRIRKFRSEIRVFANWYLIIRIWHQIRQSGFPTMAGRRVAKRSAALANKQ